MIASKLILFFCFCLLLLDDSIGIIRKSPLERGKFKKVFDQAVAYGRTYGGELEELRIQWNNLEQEIDEAKRNEGGRKDELERFDEASAEVSLAQKDVDYYEDLYGKSPSPEYKKKLDAAKETHSNKVELLIAIRNYDIALDKRYVKELEDKKDHVAIAMIARMEKINENSKITYVRKKMNEAKKNGLTNSDIKKILFEEFFRPTDVPLIGRGDATAAALLSSFRAGKESLLDGTFFQKLRKGGGDGGTSEGDDGTPEGDDGTPEGDDGTPEGDGDTPEAAGGDSEEEGDAAPEGRREDFDSIEMSILETIESLYPGISGHTIGDIEAWYFGLDDQSDRSAPQFSSDENARALRIVQAHQETTKRRSEEFRDQVDLLLKERRLGHYNYNSSTELSSLTNKEKVDVHQSIADRIQTSLDTLESIREDFDNFYPQFRQSFTLTRQNFEYYGALLGANASRISPLIILPGRSGDLPEFYNTPEDDYSFRFLLSKISLQGLIYYGVTLDDIKTDLEQEKKFLESELKYLEERIADEG